MALRITVFLLALVLLPFVCSKHKWAPGEGHYEATIVMFSFPKKVIQSWLPKGLVLKKTPIPVPADSHPVVVAFGMQYGVHPTLDPKAFNLTYKEYILSVPFTEWDKQEAKKFRYKGPFTYSPRLFLNNTQAILLGDLFGLAKKLGHFKLSANQEQYTIYDYHDWSLLTNLNTTSLGPKKKPDAFPYFKAIAEGMNSPLVAKNNLTHDWECAHFRWLLDTATIQAAEGASEIYQPFLPNMPLYSGPFKGIDKVPLGSFRIITNWTMSFPMFCWELGKNGEPEPLPKPQEQPKPKQDAAGKKKIAILGGGLGSIAATYYLTEDPDWKSKYDITVYQLGWRIGGKAASGRSTFANRIQEHGLHFMMGWYNNVFQWVQNMYAANNRPKDAPLSTWNVSFIPTPNIHLPVKTKEGTFEHEGLYFPFNNLTPGPGKALTPVQLLEELLEWLAHHNHTHRDDFRAHPMWRTVRRHGSLSKALEHDRQEFLHLLEDLQRKSVHWWPPLPSGTENLKALEYIFDTLVVTFTSIAKGIIADKIDKLGFGCVDNENIDAWLVRHGFPKDKLDNPILVGGHDLVFAFRNGLPNQPSYAAGVSLFGFLNMVLGFQGSIFYRMMSGMGDTIFGPAYQVLHKRGVKFNFFHKVEALRTTGDDISSIEINVQATVKGGPSAYNPLKTIQNLPSWMGAPDYDQLEEGKMIKEKGINLESWWNGWKGVSNVTLTKGQDFDVAFLGISIGALPFITQDLADAHPDWKAMLKNSNTVATQSIQVWTYGTTEELGFEIIRYHNKSDLYPYPTTSAFANPFNTWADMTNLLPRETWGSEYGEPPKSIQYFCGPYPLDTTKLPPFSDHDFPKRALANVVNNAKKFLPAEMPIMWKNVDNTTLWASLAAPLDVVGADRFDYQYYRVNVDPTELYVLTFPGTVKYRKKPFQSGFTNLYVVGDWTDTGINAGCAEAAVSSGLIASHHFGGYPKNFTDWYKPFNLTGH